MKKTFEMFLMYSTSEFTPERDRFNLFPFDMSGCSDSVLVCQVEVEAEVPDNYDPREQQIAELEAKKRKAIADHEVFMNSIEGKIQSLRAIEYREESCVMTADFNTTSN